MSIEFPFYPPTRPEMYFCPDIIGETPATGETPLDTPFQHPKIHPSIRRPCLGSSGYN